MQITIEVPDRLPEALALAVQELVPIETTDYQDDSPGETLRERQILELLASQPTPEVVLAIRPTRALQERMSELLAQNKSGTLT
jgi:hypothetical protein